jgi:hypothetical protein
MTQFLVAGEAGWLTAHQQTKNHAMLQSLSIHPLGGWRQLGGSGGRPPRAAAVGMKTPAATAMVGAQITINNLLKAAAAMATEMVTMTAITTNENKGNGGSGGSLAAAWHWGWWQHGSGGGGGGSLAVAAAATQRWQQQLGGSGCVIAALRAEQWQLGASGSLVAAWRRRQRGSSNKDSGGGIDGDGGENVGVDSGGGNGGRQRQWQPKQGQRWQRQ